MEKVNESAASHMGIQVNNHSVNIFNREKEYEVNFFAGEDMR